MTPSRASSRASSRTSSRTSLTGPANLPGSGPPGFPGGPVCMSCFAWVAGGGLPRKGGNLRDFHKLPMVLVRVFEAADTGVMERIRACLECGVLFEPLRRDHYFDTKTCARRYRKFHDHALPTERNMAETVPTFDRLTYIHGLRRSRPPRNVVGYKLYCKELDLWFPLPNTVRRNGLRPKYDYFKLRPNVELPRVPLATSYVIGWVYSSGTFQPTMPNQEIFCCFPSDMRLVREVGRRLKIWKANTPGIAPPSNHAAINGNSGPALSGVAAQSDSGIDENDEDY